MANQLTAAPQNLVTPYSDSQLASASMSVVEVSSADDQGSVKVINDNVKKESPESLRQLILNLSAKYEANASLALEIARCESRLTHFDPSGRIVRGRINHNDVGVFQINEVYHLKKSQALGFDIYTPEGNVAYALWMIKNTGSKPWSASRECWGNQELALVK